MACRDRREREAGPAPGPAGIGVNIIGHAFASLSWGLCPIVNLLAMIEYEIYDTAVLKYPPRQALRFHRCHILQRLTIGVPRRAKQVRCNDGLASLAMVANVGGCMSGAGCPRKSAFGKFGASTEEMKDKGAQAKPAKHQRPDRYYKEPFQDECGHAPAESE
jgi:hypothetical protein